VSNQSILWLDADDPTTMFTDTAGTQAVTASGQSVALWRDKSPKGNHATRYSTTRTGVYTTGVVTGRGVVQNTTSLSYTLRDNQALSNLSSGVSAFVVLRTAVNASGANTILPPLCTSSLSTIPWLVNGNLPGNAWLWEDFAVDTARFGVPMFDTWTAVATMYAIVGDAGSGQALLYHNRVDTGAVVTGKFSLRAFLGGTYDLAIGLCKSHPAQFWYSGHIGEIVVLRPDPGWHRRHRSRRPSALSGGSLANVANYLRQKWSIA
jgi:hypothetical protein